VSYEKRKVKQADLLNVKYSICFSAYHPHSFKHLSHVNKLVNA